MRYLLCVVFGLLTVCGLVVAVEGGKSGATAAREESSPMDIKSRLDRLESAVAELRREVGGTAVPENPVPDPPTRPPTKPTPGWEPGISADPPVQVVDILSRRCKECHAGEADRGGNFALFSGPPNPDKLAFLTPLDLVKIDHAVYSGEMPADGDPVPGEEYAIIRAWINGFAPEIRAAVADAERLRYGPR